MSRRTWLVGAFAILAFAQTLAYYVYLRDDPGNYNGAGALGDQVAYIELAQQVLHGTWQGAVHYMPGLPAIVAVGQLAFGDPRLGIALIQGLIFAALVVYASRLAARGFGERTSLWVAACVGLNPAIGYYAAQALTEFLTGAVLLLLVGGVYAWSRTPSLWRAVYAGALIGAASFLRAEYLALAVIFAGVLVWLARAPRAERRARAGGRNGARHGALGSSVCGYDRTARPVQRESILEPGADGHLVQGLRRANVLAAAADRDRARAA